jgi:hypothetical protein
MSASRRGPSLQKEQQSVRERRRRHQAAPGKRTWRRQINQRRSRSRASSTSEVDRGLRSSALRSNRPTAVLLAGSSMGRLTRCASARAARRTKELRVSPALRAAASMIRRSLSGSERRTLRTSIVYPTVIRVQWSLFRVCASSLEIDFHAKPRRREAKTSTFSSLPATPTPSPAPGSPQPARRDMPRRRLPAPASARYRRRPLPPRQSPQKVERFKVLPTGRRRDTPGRRRRVTSYCKEPHSCGRGWLAQTLRGAIAAMFPKRSRLR